MPISLEVSNEKQQQEEAVNCNPQQQMNDQPETTDSDLVKSSSPTEEECSMYMMVCSNFNNINSL